MSKTIHRENNFDFLRLLFSCLVVYSHSFHLLGTKEFLYDWSNEQIGVGPLSVKCFFIISGYLIFQSLERSKNLIDYYWKRILRLFPGLLAMLIFVVLIIIPLTYDYHIPLVKNTEYLTYLPKNFLLYPFQDSIKGVFVGNHTQGINGSLWSLPYEFTMYIIISLLIIFSKKNRLFIICFLFICFLLLANFKQNFLHSLFSSLLLSSTHFYDLACFFLAGSIFSYVDFSKVKFKNFLILICIIILTISLFLNQFYILKYLFLPPLILFFGNYSTPYLNKIGSKIGDTSYGIYIYGFPIQQTLLYFFNLSLLEHIVFSLLITFVLGYISWHLIEKRALTYKNLFSKNTK